MLHRKWYSYRLIPKRNNCESNTTSLVSKLHHLTMRVTPNNKLTHSKTVPSSFHTLSLTPFTFTFSLHSSLLWKPHFSTPSSSTKVPYHHPSLFHCFLECYWFEALFNLQLASQFSFFLRFILLPLSTFSIPFIFTFLFFQLRSFWVRFATVSSVFSTNSPFQYSGCKKVCFFMIPISIYLVPKLIPVQAFFVAYDDSLLHTEIYHFFLHFS